jgi:MFS family permease
MERAGVGQTTSVDTDSPTPVGINVGVGSVLIIVAALAAAQVPAADRPVRLGIVVVAVCGFAAGTVDQRALAWVVVASWLVANGFLENHQGQLSWHGSTDLSLMTLLVVAGAVGLAVGEAYRGVGRLRARWRAEAQLREITAHFTREGRPGA